MRWIGGGGALAGIFLLGLPNRRHRWSWMIALVLIGAAVGAIGCGGGSETPPAQGKTASTTPGSYVFTVTGTDVANAGLTTVTTVNVTVQ
jgi:hypothetical protein